jgi:DNA-binding transcriptional LysR family regulator
VDSDSIKDAQANIAQMQDALANAQRVLEAAERAQEAADQARANAERHIATLRTVSIAAIVAIVFGVLASFRRRHHD